MGKKYELTNETIVIGYKTKTFHRIKALRDFGDVKAGDLGGYIEKEDNLSHEGNCWVYDTARVYGNALVYDNARVSGDAWVYGNALVYDNAQVYGDAWVYDNARVSGDAQVFDNARASGDARVYGNAQVFDNARVFGYTWISGNAWVYDNARVSGDAWVYGNARVSDDTWVYGNASIYGNAYIKSNDDYLAIPNIGSRHDVTTFFKCEDNTIKVSCGCFKGTIEEFEKAVEKTHGDNKYGKQYKASIILAKASIILGG